MTFRQKNQTAQAKNHLLIFVVTLVALLVVGLFTLNNALNMGKFHASAMGHPEQTQIIFEKSAPYRPVAATQGVDVSTSKKTSLSTSRGLRAKAQDFKILWIISLISIFGCIGFALIMMLRNLKEDINMKAVSELHSLARAEH